jgi:hypothetical protein
VAVGALAGRTTGGSAKPRAHTAAGGRGPRSCGGGAYGQDHRKRRPQGGGAARQEVPRSRGRTPLPVGEGRAPVGCERSARIAGYDGPRGWCCSVAAKSARQEAPRGQGRTPPPVDEGLQLALFTL